MSEQTDASSIEPLELPGALLKSSREAQGLSVAEMSERSHLTKRVIIDLEGDDYRSLASLGFVRGYLRLYAKKLGLDESVVLEPFDRWSEAQSPQPESHFELNVVDEPSLFKSKRVRFGLLGGAAFILVLLCVGLFWILQSADSDTSGTPQSERVGAAERANPPASPEPEMSARSGSPGEAVPHSVAPEPLDEGRADLASDQSLAQNEASQTVGEPDSPIRESPGSDPASIQQSGDPSPDIELSDGLNAPAPSPPAPATPPPPVVEVVPGELVVRAKGDSWVEIRSAVTTEILFADLLRAGREVSLIIPGVVDLVVGAVDQTSVLFEGEILNLTDRAPRNTARIRLGESSN